LNVRAMFILGLVLTGLAASAPPRATAAVRDHAPAERGDSLEADFARLFPDEWARIRAQARRANRSGGPAAFRSSVDDAIGKFLVSHARDGLAAPDMAVRQVILKESLFYASLHHASAHACFLATRGDTSAAVVRVAPGPAADWLRAKLEAIRAGMDHPVRAPTPMTDAEARQIGDLTSKQLLEAGWTRPRIDAALDGDLAKTTEEDVCKLSMAVDLGLMAADPAVASRLFVGLQAARDER
jgi:hypothetical protein